MIYGLNSQGVRLVLPCFLFAYSIAAFVSRFALRKKSKFSFSAPVEIAFVCVGVFTAFLISEFDAESVFQTVTVAAAYFFSVAVSLAVSVGALLYKKANYRRYGFFAAIFCAAFSFAASFLAKGVAGEIISAAVAAAAAVIAVILAKVQSGGEDNNEI